MRKLLLISFLLLISCSPNINYVEINNVKVPVVLALTPEQQTKGLMNATNLAGGMLFVFDKEEIKYFWMKDTLIPLDMIFIDENNKITTIYHALPCKEVQCIIYSGEAKYVLEVNYNFTEENNIKQEMKVYFGK